MPIIFWLKVHDLVKSLFWRKYFHAVGLFLCTQHNLNKWRLFFFFSIFFIAKYLVIFTLSKVQLPWNHMKSQITFRFVCYTNSFTWNINTTPIVLHKNAYAVCELVVMLLSRRHWCRSWTALRPSWTQTFVVWRGNCHRSSSGEAGVRYWLSILRIYIYI